MKNKFTLQKPEPSFQYMPADQRSSIAPETGMCSISPADRYQDALVTANGTMTMLVYGNPLHEKVIFKHERLLAPKWKVSPEPPEIAAILPDVRRFLLKGKYQEAADMSVPPQYIPMLHSSENHPAFAMKIEMSESGMVSNYLRTLDFMSGEICVYWSDDRGKWVRRSFVSKPDQLAVQIFEAPDRGELDMEITIDTALKLQAHSWELGEMPENMEIKRTFNTETLLFTACYDKTFGNAGYAAAIQVVREGGSAYLNNGSLIIKGAKSVTLLTRIERYQVFDKSEVIRLVEYVKNIGFGYNKLLERHSAIQAGMMGRTRLKLSDNKDSLLSVEELLAQQHSGTKISGRLIESLFDMGRYFLIAESGELPPLYGQMNININLQVCSGNLTNLEECMDVFFTWIESLKNDFRENAKRIFGFRGLLGDIHPDSENGLLFHFSAEYPHHYWVACAGWLYNEFWGHYLVTGDKRFLAERVIPGLKEIAQFFEDYLTEEDDNGYYIFYPSFSPEDWPQNTGCKLAINSLMDIMVCREVLDNLITACRTLGTEKENVLRWQAMLKKLPPYLLDEEGALKEWAWQGFEENYNHRCVSHLYDVWPGNVITWEETPELAAAALMSNRKRAQENDSAHGIMHRAFVSARLKAATDVHFYIKQILEHGFITRSLMTNHYPYKVFFPDITGSFPALVIEMLVYSKPGVIELLPALPSVVRNGCIMGVCCFTYAKIEKLTWDLNIGSIDADIHSLVDQEIELRYRYGIKYLKVNGDVKETFDGACTLKFAAGESLNIGMVI